MKKSKINKQQKEVLATLSCGILDRYDNIEEHLKSHGIPKPLIKKMSKAMDLIFEVNQSCFAKNNGA